MFETLIETKEFSDQFSMKSFIGLLVISCFSTQTAWSDSDRISIRVNGGLTKLDSVKLAPGDVVQVSANAKDPKALPAEVNVEVGKSSSGWLRQNATTSYTVTKEDLKIGYVFVYVQARNNNGQGTAGPDSDFDAFETFSLKTVGTSWMPDPSPASIGKISILVNGTNYHDGDKLKFKLGDVVQVSATAHDPKKLPSVVKVEVENSSSGWLSQTASASHTVTADDLNQGSVTAVIEVRNNNSIGTTSAAFDSDERKTVYLWAIGKQWKPDPNAAQIDKVEVKIQPSTGDGKTNFNAKDAK